MEKISITNMGNDKKVSTEEMAQVKGGPHYLTLDGRGLRAASSGNITLKRG